jgi:putative peptidoglycan lipid II flippase
VSRALRVILFVMVPLTGISIVLRQDIVALLFGYGGFDQAAVDLTAATFLAFLIGLPAHALIAILARAFYAQQDTRTPVLAAIVAVVINSTLAFVLVGPLGLPGLALAIAIAAWIETAILFALLDRRVPELVLGPVARLGIRAVLVMLVSSLAAALVAQALTASGGEDPGRLQLLVRMVAATLVWATVAAGVSLALRIEEFGSIVGLMVDAIRRPRRA